MPVARANVMGTLAMILAGLLENAAALAKVAVTLALIVGTIEPL